MRQRWLILAGLGSGLLVVGGCSNGDDDSYNDNTPVTTPTNSRPKATFISEDGSSGDISVHYVPEDADGDTLSVSIQFSFDSSQFRLCAPASGYENPVSIPAGDLGNDASFVWDSQSDWNAAGLDGKVPVTVRLVANDGTQDGEPSLSDSFNVTNKNTAGDDDASGGDDDSSEDTSSELDEVGGILGLQFDDVGVSQVDLNSNASAGRDNKSEEFLLVMVNVGQSSTGYSIDQIRDTGSSSSRTAQGTGTGSSQKTGANSFVVGSEGLSRSGVATGFERRESQVTLFRQEIRDEARLQWMDRARGARVAPRIAPAADYVVGETRNEFKVRSSLTDDGSYARSLGILGAIGEGVLIFVDEKIPIGIDTDCSDTLPAQPDTQGRKTYGFDTCDLQTVADVFDKNILSHLHEYFGTESDVDDNQKITVLITQYLNTLTTTNTSTSDDDRLVPVYVDPEVDLTEFDANTNPGSNYQEIIYLAAPDPAGYFNPLTGGGGTGAIDQYVSVDMAANIAIATEELISYNTHVTVGKNDDEEDWLKDGLGLLAADLTGFGSVVYDDVFYFLDAPYLNSLTVDNTLDDTNDRGGQYLLCRYLIDRFHDKDWKGLLSSLMTSEDTGTKSLESAIQTIEPDTTFESFWLDFVTAISLDGVVNSTTGDPLIDPLTVPGFQSAKTIDVSSSAFYGAQGYQQGINIRGVNTVRNRSSDGSISATDSVRLNGANWNNYAPGISYYGFLTGGYSGQVTRIGGLIDAETLLKITGGSSDLKARIIRLNDIDPAKPTFVVEQVFGALATDIIPMQVFEDGVESVALGAINGSQSMKLTSGVQQTVLDTDLYGIDLSTWSTQSAYLYIELDRAMSNSKGEADLEGPLFAVVPYGDLPRPTTINSTYTCDGKSIDVSYPGSFLEYLYYQYVLTPTVGTLDGYNPAGMVSAEPTTCNFDYDTEMSRNTLEQNDEDEPEPTTLIDQIYTYQVQALQANSTVDGFFPFTDEFMDVENVDTDTSPSYNLPEGVGGRSVSSGEEAWLTIHLPAGASENRYVIVVGGGSTGAYQLTVRVLTDSD